MTDFKNRPLSAKLELLILPLIGVFGGGAWYITGKIEAILVATPVTIIWAVVVAYVERKEQTKK